MNNHHPVVSVIIPTYNRAHCVGEAIESVLNQTFRDFEVIVVDDGSTDNTPEVLAAFGNRIRVIGQENSGVSAARNAGIKAARGNWVAFLDSDDIWEPDKLSVQMRDVAAHPQVIAHVVDAIFIDIPGGDVSLFELRGLREEFQNRPLRPRPLCDVLRTQFFTQCWLVRKDVLEKFGGFDVDLSIYEDLNLMARVAMEGPFYVTTFMGVKVRRKTAEALSNLHQTQRLYSLSSLVKTYRVLKQDRRLTQAERRIVGRYLGGVWCEIAEQYLTMRKWSLAARALLRSVGDDFGVRGLLRALVYGVGRAKWIHRLRSKKRGGSLRRSEIGTLTPET